MARLATAATPGHGEGGARRPRVRRRRAAIAAGGTLAASGVLGALLAAGAADATSGQSPEPPTDVVEQLEGEVDAMIEDGVPADDPKVQMLQDEVDALVTGAQEAPVPEADVPSRAGRPRASTPEEGRRLAGQARARQPAERGIVECEPVPQLLGPDEIDGATCVNVPQPDGTSRYVAVGSSGDVHVVRFAPGGRVERLADRELPAGMEPTDVELAPDAEGNVDVLSDGEQVATLDVE